MAVVKCSLLQSSHFVKKKKELNDSLTAAAVQLFLAEVSAGYLYRTESFLEHERYKNPGHESSWW